MATPKNAPHWKGRPIVNADHVHDLELRSAINNFVHRMPEHEAEELAHKDYKRQQLVEAASHHLTGMKAAHAAGDMETAKKHGIMYGLALKQLDPEANIAGDPPDEVATHAKNTPHKLHGFKSHAGDAFSLPSTD